jgi:hypothetical protein
MGLDQYLKASITLPDHDALREEAKNPTTKAWSELRTYVLGTLKLKTSTNQVFGLFDVPGVLSIQLDCAYWRKANQIHRWFDRLKGPDGLENCEEIEVTFDKLAELVKLCEQLLKSRNEETAMQELPLSSGFFFGPADMGDWYWSDLRDTVNQLKPWLELPEEAKKWISFKYHGWW